MVTDVSSGHIRGSVAEAMAGYVEAARRVSDCAQVLHELVPSPETGELVVALSEETRALGRLLAEMRAAASPDPVRWSTRLRGLFE